MNGLYELVLEASRKLDGIINTTPIVPSTYLKKLFGFDVWIKMENLQKTGSFKLRGAYNKISSLSREEKRRGVITASSGNHAQGVAWAATYLGIRSVVVMPEITPIIKYIAARGYGAEVVFHGPSFDDAYAHALEMADKTGMAFIPPFEDELVMAGQGTIGLEVMEAVPEADAIVVPVGGGGLISGIAAAAKSIRESIKIIGVESEASTSCIESLKAGRPVQVEKRPTIADGIAVKKVGEKTLSIIEKYVDDVVAVKEETIAEAILKLLERKKIIVEGAGAVPLAAAMEGKLPKSIKKAVVVLSGGNIDVTTLDRVIRVGLLKEGRTLKVSTILPDVPGALAKLTAEVAEMKANILHVIHQREIEDVPVGLIRLDLILEVEGKDHGERILKTLSEKGYGV